ncbi:MAG: hypothetical protein IPG46_19100 [Actinobacteria bacterium]|nr:hypothetical protein [Actinomycetota bacterium]
MAQLSIDTTTGRLTVADGGFADCSGLESIRQHVWLRLQIFLGECAYDVGLGVPWIQEVVASGTAPERIATIFREAIIRTPGITGITSGPTLDVDDNRAMQLSFTATTDEGLLVFSSPISSKPVQEID